VVSYLSPADLAGGMNPVPGGTVLVNFLEC